MAPPTARDSSKVAHAPDSCHGASAAYKHNPQEKKKGERASLNVAKRLGSSGDCQSNSMGLNLGRARGGLIFFLIPQALSLIA